MNIINYIKNKCNLGAKDNQIIRNNKIARDITTNQVDISILQQLHKKNDVYNICDDINDNISLVLQKIDRIGGMKNE